MKKTISALIVMSMLFSVSVFSQEKVKFGDVTKKELDLESYEPDKDAPAVVLHEEKTTYYDFSSAGLFVCSDYMVRIKIFTNDGLEYANGEIIRYTGRHNSDKEMINGLTGFTHSLEDGKVVRTKLSKEHIFDEKINDVSERIKFALPKVNPGSIVEYKYTLRSPHYSSLDDYVFQREIPVKYSKFTLLIPEYFRFNKEMRGSHKISFESSRENKNAFIGKNNFMYQNEKMVFKAKNLPAFRSEEYVWSPDDFKSKIHFELMKIEIPGSIHNSFTSTWEKVDKLLMENADFGKQFHHRFFKDELKTLFTPEMKETDKLRAVYNLVRSKIQPNDNQTLWVDSPKSALNKGTGSSADINAVLLSALNEAGFNAYPVVMRLRNKGRIPLTHPTINYLNYFIVCAMIDDKPVYMDASSRYGDLNILPNNCLVDFARSIGNNGQSEWVDLSRINHSTEQTILDLSFNEEGCLAGNYKMTGSNQTGYTFRQSYNAKKDKQAYIDELQNTNNMQIADVKIENLEDTDKRVYVAYSFVKNDPTLQGDFAYFNPLVFPVFSNNPFKAEFRELPVEFNYPQKLLYRIQIALPENYTVEEIPGPGKTTLGEDDAQFLYLIQYNESNHVVTLNMNFVLNRTVYSTMDYNVLRDFFTHVSSQNNALITLKKKTEAVNAQP